MKKVEDVLNDLARIKWFTRCGEPIPNQKHRLKSWADAEQYFAGDKGLRWENWKLAISNRRRELIRDARVKSTEGLCDSEKQTRYEQFQNDARKRQAVIDEFRADYLSKIVASVFDHPELQRMVALDISWTVNELVNPTPPLNFFEALILPVYVSGHLPCGWSGTKIARKWSGNLLSDLPSGQLIIF
ncbi:MAG TPA: hypothetical protein VF773_21575 [Verrucomicrobiae bacterium]